MNLLKLNDGWRAILRRTRAADLRRDITLHGQTFERRLDGLDRFIQVTPPFPTFAPSLLHVLATSLPVGRRRRTWSATWRRRSSSRRGWDAFTCRTWSVCWLSSTNS